MQGLILCQINSESSAENLYSKQKVSSSFHQQSNGHAEACLKFVKQTMKKCFDNNTDVNLALIQIRSMPVGPGLLSPATLLFNRPMRGLVPSTSRMLINIDYDEDNYHKLKAEQNEASKNNDTFNKYTLFPIGSTEAVQWEDGGLCTHGTTPGHWDASHNGRW